MKPIKKSDVKMHFSSHQEKGLRLVQPIEKPAAFPGVSLESNQAVFVEDFSLEHSSSGVTESEIVTVANSDDSQNPETRETPRL